MGRASGKLRVAYLLAAAIAGCANPLPILADTDVSSGAASDETSAVSANSSDASGTDEADTTGPSPGCGNGIVEAGESCDRGGESADCNDDCTSVVCGDGILNQTAGEVCDATLLAGQTCQTQGFDTGELLCDGRCAYDTTACFLLPAAPTLELSLSAIKRFEFSWEADALADYYQLEERVSPGDEFVQLGGDILGGPVTHEVPLHLRAHASYRLRACNDGGCVESAVFDVSGTLVAAIGYAKASNTGPGDFFGGAVAISADGLTLAVAAPSERSAAAGVGGSQTDDSLSSVGAVYVFARDGVGAWSQQAYVKASNPDGNDVFGLDLALSGDGSTLAVGAPGEDSSAAGIDGDQTRNDAMSAGAVYLFEREPAGAWSQAAYIKASAPTAGDNFGAAVSLDDAGSVLAVGASLEDSNATGVGGNEADDSLTNAGAVYVFERDESGPWAQHNYIKASNPGSFDGFGDAVSLSGDGLRLAVGTPDEDSGATGVGGPDDNDDALASGAVYVFARGTTDWSQEAYIKASNAEAGDRFGGATHLGTDGTTLVVGATGEDSASAGTGGDEANNDVSAAGAAYVFVRDDEGTWTQQAYLKAIDPEPSMNFGEGVDINGTGDLVVVSSSSEASAQTGVDGPGAADDSAPSAGAAFVFERDSLAAWAPRAYVKPPNTGAGDRFGFSVAMSADGATLAVGAGGEASDATGIGPLQDNDNLSSAGAVYVY